jgi:acyl-homoserine lactone synthase
MMDGMSVQAVLVDCDEAIWTSLCGQIGLTRPTLTWPTLTWPTLTWHGLPDVNRRALPALSVLPPTAAQQTQ